MTPRRRHSVGETASQPSSDFLVLEVSAQSTEFSSSSGEGAASNSTSAIADQICDALAEDSAEADSAVSISSIVRPRVSKPMNQIATAPTRYQKPK